MPLATENVISTQVSPDCLDFLFLEHDLYVIASEIQDEGKRLSCLLEVQAPPHTVITKGITFYPHSRKDRTGLEYQLSGDGRLPFIPWNEVMEVVANGIIEFTVKQSLDWRAFTINHRDLLKKELPPLDFLVENLLVTPALAAPKKRGKSWMALQLAQSVASGAPFLGMTTKQGPVIHMALEDGERRLRQRLQMQHTAPDLPIICARRDTLTDG